MVLILRALPKRKKGSHQILHESAPVHSLLACSPWSAQSSFLTEPRSTSPGMASPTVVRVLSHQSLNKKVTYRFPCSLNLRMHFLNWGSFVSIKSSLCQTNIKLSSTIMNMICFLHCLVFHRNTVVAWVKACEWECAFHILMSHIILYMRGFKPYFFSFTTMLRFIYLFYAPFLSSLFVFFPYLLLPFLFLWTPYLQVHCMRTWRFLLLLWSLYISYKL